MKILLIGASSYLGARLYFDLKNNHQIIGTYFKTKLSDNFAQLDTTNEEDIKETISSVNPEVIIHAANYSNVRSCEKDLQMTKLVNEKATEIIVNHSKKINCQLIYISTYGVKDISEKYSNIYTLSKLKSETIIKNSLRNYLILQPRLIIGMSPNILNDRFSNRLLNNINEKKGGEYDTSWRFQPTYIGHISEVLELVISKKINQQTIPIMTKEIKSKFELAKDIFSSFGIEPIPIDQHNQLPLVADDLSTLKRLNLPIYSYQEIIEKLIKEYKNANYFQSGL